jgi:preprotein translocase subunit SecE
VEKAAQDLKMGVETKKMANSVAAAGDFGDRIKSWPQRIKTFYNDVRTEMKKVTTPSLKEVQATTVVVIITVFVFGAYFAVIDYILKNSLDWVLRTLAGK